MVIHLYITLQGGTQPEAIAVLMENGASINIENDEDDTPIDVARQFQREAAVQNASYAGTVISKRF